jgi:hypothetical protein
LKATIIHIHNRAGAKVPPPVGNVTAESSLRAKQGPDSQFSGLYLGTEFALLAGVWSVIAVRENTHGVDPALGWWSELLASAPSRAPGLISYLQRYGHGLGLSVASVRVPGTGRLILAPSGVSEVERHILGDLIISYVK